MWAEDRARVCVAIRAYKTLRITGANIIPGVWAGVLVSRVAACGMRWQHVARVCRSNPL